MISIIVAVKMSIICQTLFIIPKYYKLNLMFAKLKPHYCRCLVPRQGKSPPSILRHISPGTGSTAPPAQYSDKPLTTIYTTLCRNKLVTRKSTPVFSELCFVFQTKTKDTFFLGFLLSSLLRNLSHVFILLY